MIELFTTENLIALLTLASLEIVLGIDNIIFIAIISGRLPKHQQSRTRRIGLVVAMLQRIVLLLCISWIVKLTSPLFSIFEHSYSGRDLILILGGIFLIGKATFEIHENTEGGHETEESNKAPISLGMVLVQIAVLDTVFSLDSVITAVGMADSVAVMITAVIISVIVMLIFADSISKFILKHPTIKMLALSFLLLIGVVLLADGFGKHIEKGYIYFAMGFSILVEMLNFRLRNRSAPPRSA